MGKAVYSQPFAVPQDATAAQLRIVKKKPATDPSLGPTWSGDYARVAPGVYPAFTRKAKIYLDPGFKRWTCLILFDLLTSDLGSTIATIPMWLNVTDAKTGALRVSRRGKYFPTWCKANGDHARSDRMDPRVFRYRQASVKVGDNISVSPYSVVKDILEWHTGVSCYSREDQGVNQSSSQTVKKGSSNPNADKDLRQLVGNVSVLGSPHPG